MDGRRMSANRLAMNYQTPKNSSWSIGKSIASMFWSSQRSSIPRGHYLSIGQTLPLVPQESGLVHVSAEERQILQLICTSKLQMQKRSLINFTMLVLRSPKRKSARTFSGLGWMIRSPRLFLWRLTVITTIARIGRDNLSGYTRQL